MIEISELPTSFSYEVEAEGIDLAVGECDVVGLLCAVIVELALGQAADMILIDLRKREDRFQHRIAADGTIPAEIAGLAIIVRMILVALVGRQVEAAAPGIVPEALPPVIISRPQP